MARSAARCSTGWWVGPSSPRPMESCVQTYVTGHLHQRGQPHRPAHVVAEHQERAAVRAGGAVQRDPVEDRAHRVLADAEVQGAAVRVADAPQLGVDARRAGTTARPRWWCCSTRRGRRSRPTARAAPDPIALSTSPDALRVAMPFGSAGKVGTRVGPAGRALAGEQPVEQRGAGRGSRCASASKLGVPLGVRLRAALLRPPGVREHLVVDLEATCRGSRPRISLVAATSSAPSAEPCALPVLRRFGAGQPMTVRTRDERGPVGDGARRLDGGGEARPRRPRRSAARRRTGCASRRPRTGRRRPR